MSRRVTATIHLAALRNNLARVRVLAPRSRVMAVVKADGYGHGLERVALALRDADAFGVASIADGARIRALGLSHRIVVLSGVDEPGDLSRMRALALEPVIHHISQVELLEREWASETASPSMSTWIKCDTGMHRLGFSPEATDGVLSRLRALPGVGELQLMTHFANSDVASDPLTLRQMERFRALHGSLAADASAVLPLSLANSAGILGFAESHADWVRAGGVLYGISVIDGQSGRDHGFDSAMTLSARLIAINFIPAGECVGYGHAWRAGRESRIGVVAIGYADGYPRSLSADTPVVVRGQRVPIVGRVSMDLITIDLTDLPDVWVGDQVVMWGKDLPVEEIARSASTIGYELVCGMTRRVDFVEDAGIH